MLPGRPESSQPRGSSTSQRRRRTRRSSRLSSRLWNPVRDHFDRLGRHTEQAQRLVTVVGRDADQTVAPAGGRVQAPCPVVAETPERPAGARQKLPLLRIEPVACRQAIGLRARGHPREIAAERGGERRETANPVEHLQLGAVEVRDEGAIWPATGNGVVERGQVVEVEKVGAVEAGAEEHVLPSVRLVLGELGREGGERPVGSPGALFVGGMERHGRRHHVLTVAKGGKCGSKVGGGDAEPGEEGGRVGALAG